LFYLFITAEILKDPEKFLLPVFKALVVMFSSSVTCRWPGPIRSRP